MISMVKMEEIMFIKMILMLVFTFNHHFKIYFRKFTIELHSIGSTISTTT